MSNKLKIQQETVVQDSGPDLFIQDEGTIFLIHGLTPIGKDWLTEHIGDDARMFGQAIVVEHRYISDIVDGAVADGLVVE